MLAPSVSAALDRRTVSAELLIHMDFRDTPRRWWTGRGWLDTAGHLWQGMGTLITIDGIETAPGGVASQATFTLSGVTPDVVALARSASDRVHGRDVTVSVQFFRTDAPDMCEPLDAPVAVWAGEMDQMVYTASGDVSRIVTLTAESLWSDRNRPPFGLWTDRDQQARFPGDRGWRHAAALVNKTIRWPTF